MRVRGREREREGGRGPISVAYVHVIFVLLNALEFARTHTRTHTHAHIHTHTHTTTWTHTCCVFYRQFKERRGTIWLGCILYLQRNSFNCNLLLIPKHILTQRERERGIKTIATLYVCALLCVTFFLFEMCNNSIKLCKSSFIGSDTKCVKEKEKTIKQIKSEVQSENI